MFRCILQLWYALYRLDLRLFHHTWDMVLIHAHGHDEPPYDMRMSAIPAQTHNQRTAVRDLRSQDFSILAVRKC